MIRLPRWLGPVHHPSRREGATALPVHDASVAPANAGIPDQTRGDSASVRAETGALRDGRARHDTATVTFQAAALLLAYPDEQLLDRLDVIAAALAGTPAERHVAPLLAHLRGGGLAELQSFHVQEFDLSRRHSLHVTYWTEGDTRRRGAVLADIKQQYRESGLLVDTGGELPDYLPMVLEFAARDPQRGLALLHRFRASLEMIRLELQGDDLPHAGVLVAVCERLGGPSPASRAEIQARYAPEIAGAGQPVEFVGLDLISTGREGVHR